MTKLSARAEITATGTSGRRVRSERTPLTPFIPGIRKSSRIRSMSMTEAMRSTASPKVPLSSTST